MSQGSPVVSAVIFDWGGTLTPWHTVDPTQAWQAAADANGGVHPDVAPVSSRVLRRMRTSARPALRGAGMITG